MMYIANSEFINTGKKTEVCKTASWFIWRKELGFVLGKPSRLPSLSAEQFVSKAVRISTGSGGAVLNVDVWRRLVT